MSYCHHILPAAQEMIERLEGQSADGIAIAKEIQAQTLRADDNAKQVQILTAKIDGMLLMASVFAASSK